MKLIVNGRERTADDGCTVTGLIRSVGLDPRWDIVELNGEPVGRGHYDESKLEPGDRLELVRAVAGG
jgi:sulfur carrier protein